MILSVMMMNDGKIDASELKAVVIPRFLLPPSAVNGMVEIVNDVFGSASASYVLDNNKCERSDIVDNEYRHIFEKVKRKYKKKNFVYITEMPFFVVMHRIETEEILWFFMIKSTIKHVKEGIYNAYDEDRKRLGGIVTVPHDMKKMKKRLHKAKGAK